MWWNIPGVSVSPFTAASQIKWFLKFFLGLGQGLKLRLQINNLWKALKKSSQVNAKFNVEHGRLNTVFSRPCVEETCFNYAEFLWYLITKNVRCHFTLIIYHHIKNISQQSNVAAPIITLVCGRKQSPGDVLSGRLLLCGKSISAGIYLVKVNNRNTRTRCEICSKLTLKTSERRQWRHFGFFIVNFEHISHLVLVFLLLTLNM